MMVGDLIHTASLHLDNPTPIIANLFNSRKAASLVLAMIEMIIMIKEVVIKRRRDKMSSLCQLEVITAEMEKIKETGIMEEIPESEIERHLEIES